MKHSVKLLIISGILTIGSMNYALSEEKTTDQYIKESANYLHYSCRTIVEKFKNDENAIFDAIEKLIAVSLYNRNIDLMDVKLTEKEKKEIKAEFIDQIEEGCAADSDALLAGIVDKTVGELVLYY